MKKLFKTVIVTGLCLSTLVGCGSSETTVPADLNSLSVEEIIEKAKEDGKIESVGMPDTWANWIETWEE